MWICAHLQRLQCIVCPTLQAPKSTVATRRNLTMNMNRTAQPTFAREMKDSLATGHPTTIKLLEEQNCLKARLNVVEKEVAYKLLDLRKEGQKEYTIFEKGMIHKG